MFEAEDVSCYAAQDVWHVSFFEELNRVSYFRDVAVYGEDAGGEFFHVGFQRCEFGPGAYRAFCRDGSRSFLYADVFGLSVENADEVCRFRLIIQINEVRVLQNQSPLDSVNGDALKCLTISLQIYGLCEQNGTCG